MKCAEYFYNEKDAYDFEKIVLNGETEKIIDEECDETCWVVYYDPKPYYNN